ncbi:uncharacterized protein [Amphiura filiformis]|uniref:uncharacterized protein n=1 Tax=Amphiura filiformis TaxID=82378 RepID=UPI003B215B3B
MGKKAKQPRRDEECPGGYTLDTVSVTSSLALETFEKRKMRQLVDDILQSRSSRQYLKMLSYQLIPLIALVVTCSILLAQSALIHSSARLLQTVVEDNDNIGRFVIKLQVERGLTTTYLSSNRTQTYIHEELLSAQRNTDKAFSLINSWPDTTFDVTYDEYALDKTSVEHKIRQHRERVNQTRYTKFQPENCFAENIHFYSNINKGLIEANIIASRQLEASVWYQLIAKQSLLLATDFYGIERALGSVFYIQCALNVENMIWFRTARTQGEMMLSQAFNYDYKVRTEYNDHLMRVDVNNALIQVEQMRAEILNNSNVCVTGKTDNIETKSLEWFNNSTRLINILSDVRSEISNDISRYVEETKQSTFRMIILYSLTATMTLLACVTLSIFHARKSHTLLSSISYYAKDLSEKKTELASEKKLTLRLVYQLIPKGVAKQLQAGKSVEAMVFEEVTIYFSNIEGFTNFAARSTPMQVINLLNQLYR